MCLGGIPEAEGGDGVLGSSQPARGLGERCKV